MPDETARYRAIEEVEHAAVVEVLNLGFGRVGGQSSAHQVSSSQFRVVEADGALVTALRHSRLRQWWLGRPVPSAQVTYLATPPQHRGHGYGTELLRGLFGELHDAGVPTVTLFASTGAFYRGAGFEYAGSWTVYEARAERLPQTTAPYRARQVPLDDLGEIHALYAQVAPGRHGAFERDEAWWRLELLGDPDTTRAFVLDGPDGPAAWLIASFTIEHQPVWGARVQVKDWGGLPGTQAALLGLLGGYRSMSGQVTWTGPDPDPTLLALPDRSFKATRSEPWMLRVVDLQAAFTARPYPAWVSGQVGFTVTDRHCPWNEGSWVLEVAEGKGSMERGQAGTGVADVRALAALFTGYQDPADLAAAGLLRGFEDEELALLRDACCVRRPWTAEHY